MPVAIPRGPPIPVQIWTDFRLQPRYKYMRIR
jgi:hypothetical protein